MINFNLYYLLNGLIILSYIEIRNNYLELETLKKIEYFGLSRENTIYTIYILFLISRYFKSIIIEEFIYLFIFYTKLTIFIILIIGKTNLDIIVLYVISNILISIIIDLPKIESENNFIEIKNIVSLNSYLNNEIKDIKYNFENCKKSEIYIKNHIQLNNKNQFSKYINNHYVFCVFNASFAYNCNYLQILWNKFSLLKNKNLNFIKLDVEKIKDIADKYKINISQYSRQVPTLILFKNGMEIKRFPPINNKGRVAKVKTYDPKLLMKYFDLENIFLAGFL